MASVQAKEQKSGQALVDEIAGRIRQQIMSGEIPIGAQLRQAALAAEFGVSRTPVREALRQLQSGGLITVVPNRGAVVHVPSPWDVRAAHEVRAELEGLAAERAATRISDDAARPAAQGAGDDAQGLREAGARRQTPARRRRRSPTTRSTRRSTRPPATRGSRR